MGSVRRGTSGRLSMGDRSEAQISSAMVQTACLRPDRNIAPSGVRSQATGRRFENLAGPVFVFG